ncbi:MAG: response regulator [Lachnospiraceae bacterium]
MVTFNEREYLIKNEIRVNQRVSKILWMTNITGPLMAFITYIGVFSIPYKFCYTFTLYTLAVSIIQHVLMKKEKYLGVTKYFGILALEVLVGISAMQAPVGIYITYALVTFLSCMYVDVRYTKWVTFYSYIVLVVALYFRSKDLMRLNWIKESQMQWYIMYLVGFTIEFIFVYLIAVSIVKYEQELLLGMEQEVKERTEAEEENKAKSLFLANTSHEIRTPINAVLGMDEMILRESTQPQIREYAIHIQSASRTLLNIVNEILDLSKIKSGKLEIIEREYSTMSVLNDLLVMFGIQAKEKGLEFKYFIQEKLPVVLYGDEFRIKQAISNLLSNSVKYTEQGSVELRVNWNTYSQKKGTLFFSVIDSGIGIRQKDLDKLFLSFERVNEERIQSIQGTGLGLQITKQLVEMMGGRVSVQSEYGKGSIFGFQLQQQVVDETPIGDFEQKNLEDNGSFAESGNQEFLYAPKAKVLVVDDNEMNRRVIRELLKRTKIQIELAESGEECLRKIKTSKYHVILMDHMMPGMDGIETLKKMREEEHLCKESVVIVLTANAITGAKKSYLDAGFDNYLAKPISGRELENMLAEYLPKDLVSYSLGCHLDMEKGLAYLNGDKEQYMEIIHIFESDYRKTREKLSEKLKEQSVQEYRILIHSLKGNAKMIGADCLAELAYLEEQECKSGNLNFANLHFQQVMEEWDLVLNEIRRIQGTMILKENCNKNITPEMKDNLQEVLDNLEEFEYEEAIRVIKEKILGGNEDDSI